jgi:glycosyltransferase involved in cell wall biosynthesis
MKMHVTVILAVHNGAASIDAAVESIVAQSYRDWDLLVIDDASTDATPAKVDAWSLRDPRVSVVHNDRNLGLAASLNLAWRRARGELIARMDADDMSLPERLVTQVEFLRSHPEIDVVGTGAYLLEDDGRPRGISLRAADHEQLIAKMYKEVPFIHPSVMMRRRFLEALDGYDPRLRRGQDYDLWSRGHRRFRYANLSRPLIKYRVRGRPTFRAIFYATWVVARAVLRDGRVLTHAWWPLRWFLGMTAAKLGLWRLRNP